MSGHTFLFDSKRFERLNDPRRLQTEVSDLDLACLLALRGGEDVLDLGSGTGFYTDRVAALTTGTVYAVELQPEMNEHYKLRGVPANVRLIPGDITALPLRPSAEATLEPASVDVAYSVITWHEVGDKADLPALGRILRPESRLIVIDWRKDPESWEIGPPEDVRLSKEAVADALATHFSHIRVEDLGRFMFAVAAQRGKD